MSIVSCSAGTTSFRCPTKWEIWRQLIALLPRGRAWQTHEQVGEFFTGHNSQVGTFEVGDTGLGSEPNVERLTVMQQFWAAYAEVLEYLHQRACLLIEEFFCRTINETADEWRREFGYPDACDPWHSLCDKVKALGGSTCSYLQSLAADRGWALSCSECDTTSNGPRADCARSDCAKTCDCAINTIWVTIRLDQSTAYVKPKMRGARADCATADTAVAGPCPPGAEPLQCLIERYKPAHVKAIYIYVGAPE
jgi:uncharacterized protein YmfQ (DUF2313 family)